MLLRCQGGHDLVLLLLGHDSAAAGRRYGRDGSLRRSSAGSGRRRGQSGSGSGVCSRSAMMGAVDLVDLGNDAIIIVATQALGAAALRGGIVVPLGCQSRTQVIEYEVAIVLIRRAVVVWCVLLQLLL